MIKVLIVDDEPFVREGLKILIEWERYGYTICGEAENGKRALEAVEQVRPDVIITDIRMPIMDGLQLIKNVYDEKKSDIKFIILSGYNDFSYAKTAIQFRVKNYLLKPIDREELITTLNEMKIDIEKQISFKQKEIEGSKAIVENIVTSLIRGDTNNELVESGENILKLHNSSVIRYVIVEAEKNKEQTKKNDIIQRKIKMEGVIKNIIGTEFTNNLITLNELQSNNIVLGIIITSEMLKKYSQDVTSFVEDIYKKAKLRLDFSISIFVGKKVDKVSLLKDSYNSALLARSYGSFSSGNNIIYYESTMNRPFSHEFDEKISFDLLVDAIENGNNDKINETINNIFYNVKNQFIDPKLIGLNINYLIHQVVRIVIKMNGNASELLYNYPFTKIHVEILTIDEIKSEILEFSKEVSKYIGVLRSKQSKGILSSVEEYIIENYNQCLTLKSIANYFYINSAYLGQIFKKNFGITFNDYLLQIRIDKAKSLLNRTDMKIYEIAESVGYKDCDYFICNFERITGYTPLQYKKNILNKT